MDKPKIGRAILISIIFCILLGLPLVFFSLFIGIFAMGCGGSCNTSPLPWIVFGVCLGLGITLLVIEYFILRRLLHFKPHLIVGWIFLSFVGVYISAFVITNIVFFISNIGTDAILKEMNAPYEDAKLVKPVVSVTDYAYDSSSKQVEIEVTSKNEAKVTVVGLLGKSRGKGGIDHVIRKEFKGLSVGHNPQRIRFIFSDTANEKISNLNVFRVFMYLEANPDDYSSKAILNDIFVDDLQDSGKSILIRSEDELSLKRDLNYSLPQ